MKKKSHYFELYVTRVMKQVSDKNTLTLNAKQQLNSFICIFINRLASDIIKLLEFVNRKICTTKEVSSVLHIMLNEGASHLLQNCISEGEKAVETYKLFDPDNKNHISKCNKAGIIFPPTLIDKMLKKHNITISHISHTSVYIAAVCEYLIYEILDVAAVNYCGGDKKRITIKELDLAVRHDHELSFVFNSLNTYFLISKGEKGGDDGHILAKSSFMRLVKQYSKNAKLPKNTLFLLQTYIEKYIIDLLTNASYLATHANRIKLIPIDIKLIMSMFDKKPCDNPYIKKTDEIEELLMI